MMGQPHFNQLASEKDSYYLYQWVPINNRNSSPNDSWTGFLLYQKDAVPPQTLSFSDSWQNYPGIPSSNIHGGCYLFCRATPSDHTTFLNRLVELLEELSQEEKNFSYRYFLWIFNPDAKITRDLLPQCLPFKSNLKELSGKIINQSSSTRRNNAVSFGNIYAAFPVGVSINAVPETNTILFKNFNNNIKLWNSNGPENFGVIREQVVLSLDDDSGALRFKGSLSTKSISGNDFIKMETGVRYFIKNGETDSLSQLYPVWRSMEDNVIYQIEASLDPLWPEDHDRTYFQFLAPETQGESLGAFLSSFITPNGHSIWLTPLASNARLVFMAGLLKSDEKPRNTTGLFYIAPSGNFIISMDESSEDPELNLLMCGLSGTECLSFQPETAAVKGFLLGFKPDMPAYAPNFPFQQASPVGPPIDPSTSPLNDTLKTSWITLLKQTAEGESTFIALPKGFSLYGCDNKIHKDHNQFLGFTAPGSNFALSGEYHFPMAPYTDVKLIEWNKDQVETFEKEVLSPTRRTMFAKSNTSFKTPRNLLTREDAPTFNITTPSGQLVTMNKTGAWEKILLGQLTHPAESQMYFHNPQPELTQAFQTSDLMLVVANPQYLGTMGDGKTAAFNNTLNLENWVLAAQVGENYSYGDYSNIIIVKGRKGKLFDPDSPVSENLVATPDKWTQKGDFAAPKGKKDELVPLTQWLLDYFKEASDKGASKTDPDALYFERFNRIAKDENWTGILVLRAKIADLPEQMKGIAVGVKDKSAFYAHHFAIEISQTQIGANGPELKGPSSVYGLIYYHDPAYDSSKPGEPASPDPGSVYDFRLLSLKVLFENSMVKHFQSYAQVTLNELFGSLVCKMGEGGNPYNSIILRGSYQENGGNPVYSLSTIKDYIFLFDNNVLNKIEIASARMNTVSATQNKTEILFGMTGYLDFKILQKGSGNDALNIDLFSFGSADGKTVREGLHFSNMGLEMHYPTPAPEQKTFTFSTQNIRFDVESSTIRDDSLYRSFVLELEGLNSGSNQDNTPVKQGFINVITDLRLSGVDKGAWNGLRFRLNLGTPGELAGKVGLNADLLLAWSAQGGKDNDYQVNVGLSLPGAAGGASMISLQNVLKLSFGPIRLLYAKENEISTDRRFMLLLTDITLKFLGLMKIPPNGTTMFYLFGNPQSGGKPSGLGWYAMYRQNEPESAEPESNKRLSRAE